MPDPNPFSSDALAKAVRDLDTKDLHDQINLGFEATKDDQGVELIGEKDLGKGISVEGDASWFQKAGWKVVGQIGWRPKR